MTTTGISVSPAVHACRRINTFWVRNTYAIFSNTKCTVVLPSAIKRSVDFHNCLPRFHVSKRLTFIIASFLSYIFFKFFFFIFNYLPILRCYIFLRTTFIDRYTRKRVKGVKSFQRPASDGNAQSQCTLFTPHRLSLLYKFYTSRTFKLDTRVSIWFRSVDTWKIFV